MLVWLSLCAYADPPSEGEKSLVIATSLSARTEASTRGTVAYSVPIGEKVSVVERLDGWAKLDTGFYVDLRFLAATDDLKATLEAGYKAAKPEEQATWSERLAALAAREAQQARETRARQEAKARQAPFNSIEHSAFQNKPPAEGQIWLAPLGPAISGEAGKVRIELPPGAAVPPEVWVLPKSGVAKRGKTTPLEPFAYDCSGMEVRPIDVAVDLGGEPAIAFTSAKEPPKSWFAPSPPQQHSRVAPKDLADWLSLLAKGKELDVYTYELGGERVVAAAFPSATVIPGGENYTTILAKTVGKTTTVTGSAIWYDENASSYSTMPDRWHRDIDGDGKIELFVLGYCGGSLFDTQGRPIIGDSFRCCGC